MVFSRGNVWRILALDRCTIHLNKVSLETALSYLFQVVSPRN